MGIKLKVAMGIEPAVYNEIREGVIKQESLRGADAQDIVAVESAMGAWERSEQLQQGIAAALSVKLVGEMVKNPEVNQPVQITLSINGVKKVI